MTSTGMSIGREEITRGRLDIDGKNKLRSLSRKVELNGWKWWRRHGMTEIDEGFCPKLDSWTIWDTRLDEEED